MKNAKVLNYEDHYIISFTFINSAYPKFSYKDSLFNAFLLKIGGVDMNESSLDNWVIKFPKNDRDKRLIMFYNNI